MLVSSRTAVDSLDVFGVHGDGSSGILNDLVPFAHGAVASGAVGVEDGVGLAEDGLGIEIDGLVVCLVAIGLVSSLLQLGGIFFALGRCQGLDGGFVDFG